MMYLFRPTLQFLSYTRPRPPSIAHWFLASGGSSNSRRLLASSSGKDPTDEKVDRIAEQYAIAKDEFEIAVEETEKKSIYAADDRATVREELEKLEVLFKETIGSSPAEQGEEIKGRVSQRIRELKSAVEELNKADLED